MANNLLHGGTTNDEGFKSLAEEIYSQIFLANPDFPSNGQVRAAVTAAEENPHAMEALVKKKEDDEELTAQMIEAGEAILSESARQAEELRRHQEAWDNAPSSEYPGMTNKDVLAGLNRICANINYYSAEAVRQGKIKQDEVPLYKYAFTEKLWLMEQQRNNKTDSPEYKRRKIEYDTKKSENPNVFNVADDTIKSTSVWKRNLSTEEQVAVNLSDVGNEARIRSRSSSFDKANDVLRVGDPDLKIIGQPASVWREGDEKEFNGIDRSAFLQSKNEGGIKAENITGGFNAAAGFEGIMTPALDNTAPKEIIVAANAGYNVSKGML